MTKPLAAAVTVTGVTSDKDKNAAYEKAVQNALCEALGKNKCKGMTALQKALSLHDWLVINCQYAVYGGHTCHCSPADKQQEAHRHV